MRYFFLLVISIILASCQKQKKVDDFYFPRLMEIPKGFDDIQFPEDNEFTKKRWDLGKKLFFDPILSVDSTISCASCHMLKNAFSDEVSLSLGVEDRLGTRNSPSIANVAYHPYLTRDGGVPSLEMHVLVPIQEHNEFDFNIVEIYKKLRKDSVYSSMAEIAYGRKMDAFVVTRSIASFQRSLLSGYSFYDQFVYHGKENILSESALRGMNLFFSVKTNCSSCHSDFNFTNYSFQNNGLYIDYEDEGRYRVTGLESDKNLFKVPSLRNIGLSAPYMHDGSIETLAEVIDHYDAGGKDHVQKSDLILPLNLSMSQKQDLVMFLHSLTDESFINNPLFKK